MSLLYICRDCSCINDDDLICMNCEGDDIAVESRVEFNDEADQKRLAQIRQYWNEQYAATDFFAAAADVVRVETDTLPIIRMGVRQAS